MVAPQKVHFRVRHFGGVFIFRLTFTVSSPQVNPGQLALQPPDMWRAANGFFTNGFPQNPRKLAVLSDKGRHHKPRAPRADSLEALASLWLCAGARDQGALKIGSERGPIGV